MADLPASFIGKDKKMEMLFTVIISLSGLLFCACLFSLLMAAVVFKSVCYVKDSAVNLLQAVCETTMMLCAYTVANMVQNSNIRIFIILMLIVQCMDLLRGLRAVTYDFMQEWFEFGTQQGFVKVIRKKEPDRNEQSNGK